MVPECLTLVSLSGRATYTAVCPMSMCWIPRKCWEEIMVVITLPPRWRLLEVYVGQTQKEELFIYMASALGMLLEGWGAAGGGREEEVRDNVLSCSHRHLKPDEQHKPDRWFSSATEKSFLFMTRLLLKLWGWCHCCEARALTCVHTSPSLCVCVCVGG